jgi:poly-gamma-glutamate synthesis protein (capsule biosynthesis protein)
VEGLTESLECLERENIKVAGAGRNLAAAQAPAVLEIREVPLLVHSFSLSFSLSLCLSVCLFAESVPQAGRVLVFGFGSPDSGVPRVWAAGPDKPGLNFLGTYSEKAAEEAANVIRAVRRDNDVVIASIHWGSNWGYQIPEAHRRFARALIDMARVDIVHGHSSHHPRAVEIYRDRPIMVPPSICMRFLFNSLTSFSMDVETS